MALSNLLSFFRIRSRTPASDQPIAFANAQELLDFLSEHLYVEDTSGATVGKLTFGSVDPQGEDNRAQVYHLLRDDAERPVATRVWSRTHYVDFERKIVREARLYPIGAVPDGWVRADGNGGTDNLMDSEPNEALGYYQFMGF